MQAKDIKRRVIKQRIRRLRKHTERSYNLFKHRSGLERLRLKSRKSCQVGPNRDSLHCRNLSP